MDALYARPDEWSRKAALNCLNMGYFSSDRSVREYADRIWDVQAGASWDALIGRVVQAR